ncbi:MAG: hypothetical protein ACJ796_10070 [Gemmatimonadaceae bacterium]
MNAQQERVVESFRRIGGWFTANPQYVAGNPQLGTQVETFNGVISRLTDHVTAQETQHAQSLLISKDEIELRREVVVHQMRPIAKVARALRGTVPGIGVLSAPKGNVRTPEIIASAAAMAEKAEVYKDVLLESGLPTGFIEQLKKAGAALKSSVDSRGLARASRAAATQGVESELGVGRRIVAILDAVVTGLIRSDPVKLAEWEQLKRVTVKGAAVRGALALVHTGSTQGQVSSTQSQTSSTHVATTSIGVVTSSTDVVPASTTSVKAA